MKRHTDFSRARRRGFTLVELMVALAGGLLMAVFVFMLASQGSKFYRHEARAADATMSVMNGFQRLRADIARAAFLSSPNIQMDPFVCAPADNYASVPALQNLAAIRLTVGGSYDEAGNAGNTAAVGFWNRGDADDIKPDSILLAGSYASVDQYPAAEVVQTGSDSDAVWRIYLQPNSGSMARLGYRTVGDQTDAQRIALVSTVFAHGRALRIIDKKGSHHYGVVDSVGIDLSDGERAPYIELQNTVALVQDSVNSTCGLQGLNRGAVVNVVNFVRYRLENLKGDGTGPYDPIYNDAVEDTFEEGRTELVRAEIQGNGTTAFSDTEELVAEYAVDLKFSITSLTLGTPNTLTRFEEGDDMTTLVGLPTSGARPHLIRTVHARLAVRSREGDRGGDVPSSVAPNVGFYRVPLDDGDAPFARVRTLQADIALRNNYGKRWTL